MKILTTLAFGAAFVAAPAMAQDVTATADAAAPAAGMGVATETAAPPSSVAPDGVGATGPAAPTAAAQAQTTAQAPATPAPAATEVTDAEVESFAKAAVELQKIDQDTAIAAEEKQAKMAATVQENGLTPQRFNEISTQTQTDAELQQRLQVALSAKAGPAG